MIEGLNGELEQSGAGALAWITGALRRHDVPYQVVGSLAAEAHRPLADIDLYVPFGRATNRLQEIQPFVAWGPEHYVDETWNLGFLKVDYDGQRIEFGDSSTDLRFFGATDGRWERQHIDYANSTTARVLGAEIEVMPRDELIRYKSTLGREVGLPGIDQMTGANSWLRK